MAASVLVIGSNSVIHVVFVLQLSKACSLFILITCNANEAAGEIHKKAL